MSAYRPIQNLSAILIFLQLISSFFMMTVIGLAIASFGTKSALERFSASRDSLDMSEPQLGIIEQTLLFPISKIEILALNCWKAGLIATTITLLVFVIWTMFGHRNITEIGARDIRHISALTFFYWFIPFLNMFLPHLALKELWHGSNPSGLTMRRKATSASPRIIGAHWLAFVLGFSWYPTIIVAVIILKMNGFNAFNWFDDYMASGGWRDIYKWAIITAVATVFMNITGVFLVNQISQMQNDRFHIHNARNS